MTLSQTPLARCRRWVGLTQVELARRVGVSVSSIRQYERGVKTPSVRTAVKIARALTDAAPDDHEIIVEDLFGDESGVVGE